MQLAYGPHVLKYVFPAYTFSESLYGSAAYADPLRVHQQCMAALGSVKSLLSVHTASAKPMLAAAMTPTADQQSPGLPACTPHGLSAHLHITPHPKLMQLLTLRNFDAGPHSLSYFGGNSMLTLAGVGAGGRLGATVGKGTAVVPWILPVFKHKKLSDYCANLDISHY